jgi:hypothetical protein
LLNFTTRKKIKMKIVESFENKILSWIWTVHLELSRREEPKPASYLWVPITVGFRVYRERERGAGIANRKKKKKQRPQQHEDACAILKTNCAPNCRYSHTQFQQKKEKKKKISYSFCQSHCQARRDSGYCQAPAQQQ